MKKERIFWGIFLVVGAVFLIISGMHLLPGIPFFRLLLTILLAGCLIKSLLVVSFTGILFSIAFLCILHAEALGITAITPWPVLGAALLGSIGLSLIFPHRHKYWKNHVAEEFESVDQVDGNVIQLSTSFGSSIKYVNSEDLEHVKLECSFGAMKVYFDNAIIQSGKAQLDMHVSFGGVELYVPRGWRVSNQLRASFGGVDEKIKNTYVTEDSPTLVLAGSVSFSGVTILYV